MKGYIRDRERQEKVSRWTGVGLTVAIHLIVATTFVFTGFRYVYPPPQEKIIIAFEDIDALPEPEVIPTKRGEAESEFVDPERPVEEVIAATSPLVSNTKNDAPATRPTPAGDVEIPQTPETPLDERAIFPGHARRDTTSNSQGAKEASGTLTQGQPEGGLTGAQDGEANAHVEGRAITVRGRVTGKANQEGTVVVAIWVDPDGNVVDARLSKYNKCGEPELIKMAMKAAKEFKFAPKPDDVQRREGTVTVSFKLK